MADEKLKGVLHRMRTLAQVRALRGHGDGALLKQFVADNDEAAFEVLVQRHGPMVLGVCRRILADVHDAEDAFQATFFLLARRASTIRKPGAVGAWLHAVAIQIAVRARKSRSQRNRAQMPTGYDVGQTETNEAARVEWQELWPVLDEEVGRLPEKYRAPVVLCYLEDRSNAEAAEQLGWPVGTVKGRLARARSLLQTRLARRGVALAPGVFAMTGGSQTVWSVPLPPTLATTTVSQAMQIAMGTAPAAAGVTPATAALYRRGLQAMSFVGKVKIAGALLALVGVCGFSGVLAYNVLAGHELFHAAGTRRASGPSDQTPRDPNEKPGSEAARTEPAGVPLVARLVGAKDFYLLELDGLSAEDFRKKIEELALVRRPGGPRYPPSPKVHLKLELTNTGKEEIKVRVRGNVNKLTLDLNGPGVFYAPIVVQSNTPILRKPDVVPIAPGETIILTEIPTLALPKPGVGTQAYWTKPGDYTLTVDYILGVSPAPAEAKDVGDGFGEVTVHSVPIVLKVVEAKE